ncbi:hypothetical protein XENOCAPTIV_029509, partial [Xenoophorus captivus]
LTSTKDKGEHLSSSFYQAATVIRLQGLSCRCYPALGIAEPRNWHQEEWHLTSDRMGLCNMPPPTGGQKGESY